MLQAKKYFYVAIVVAASSLIVGCPRPVTPPSSDSTPPGFLSVNVTLETGTAPGATTVAVGPIDLAAAGSDITRSGLATTIGTVRVVATAGDPESGIKSLTINGTAQWKCAPLVPGSPGFEEPLPFTPIFTPTSPPSTPATLNAVATPIRHSGCPVPAPTGSSDRSTLRGWFTVTATSLGGSTTTKRFDFFYTDF
jgi:hypothetical protein